MNRIRNIEVEQQIEKGRRFLPTIRGLIWLYFYLLMFEGVLRKWLLPGISNELLLVKDPVAVIIYVLAIFAGVPFLHGIVLSLAVLGIAAAFTGISVGSQNLMVTAYGFDACFLHLPLIFLIPKVMDREDVIKIGRVVLLLSIPMAVLMVIQFRSTPDDWINCGAGGGIGAQIRGALGRIRPPGFFTFITGAAQFLAVASAFLIFGFLRKDIYGKLLLYAAGFAIVISVAVSSSRLALGGIGMVFSMVGFIVLLNRENIGNVFRLLLPVGLILLSATSLDVFHEGRSVFEARMQEAGDIGTGLAGTAANWSQRLFGDVIAGMQACTTAPILGNGLGLGTNVGAKLVSGETGFLLAEGEHARVILEMGPILGSLYLLLRFSICVLILMKALHSIEENNFLPILLLGSCALLITSGQFSQATTVGFAVLTAGLCTAACNMPAQDETQHESPKRTPERIKVRRGRSIYAEALHTGQTNDVRL